MSVPKRKPVDLSLIASRQRRQLLDGNSAGPLHTTHTQEISGRRLVVLRDRRSPSMGLELAFKSRTAKTVLSPCQLFPQRKLCSLSPMRLLLRYDRNEKMGVVAAPCVKNVFAFVAQVFVHLCVSYVRKAVDVAPLHDHLDSLTGFKEG